MVKRPVDQTQTGAPYGVGVHDRKRGGELTRAIAFAPQ